MDIWLGQSLGSRAPASELDGSWRVPVDGLDWDDAHEETTTVFVERAPSIADDPTPPLP